MALSDYPPMCRPFRVIDERLTYHIATGRILDGLSYDFEGKLEGRGVREYPFIQPVAFSDVETIGPGANISMSAESGNVQGNSPSWDEQSFAFWVFARRTYGFYQRDTTGTKYGVMDWVAKIRDAVETKVDGSGDLDRRLEGTVARNIQSVVSQNETTEIGWACLLEFNLQTDTYCPGGRWGE